MMTQPETTSTPTVNPQADELVQLCPHYSVLLHNDDVNDMDDVVRALRCVFSDMLDGEAIDLTLEAHEEGSSLVRTEPRERAEFHQERMQAFSLTATIEHTV